MNKLEMFNGLGRPVLRAVTVVVLSVIGLAVGWAFVAWSVFHVALPPLPGEALILAGLPYAQAGWDNWVRGTERKAQIAFGQVPGQASPNPHGGPGAP